MPRAGDRIPRVSVVTPTFNREGLLGETIASVLGQTFGDLEHLVVDDGSTDRTADRIRAYDDPRLRYYRFAHAGQSPATNRGFELARGEYVAVLSSDDPVRPEWLAESIGFMDAHPEVLVGYPDWDVIDAESRVIQTVTTFEYDFASMVGWFHPFPGPGALVRRAPCLRIGSFRAPRYRYVPDLETWFRLGLLGPFARIPAPLATWRSHGTAITVADRSPARAREMVRLAQRFFRRRDVPAEVRKLRSFTLSRACWLSAWVLAPRHPTLAGLYLRRSYRLAPADPPGLPEMLTRLPSPGLGDLLGTARAELGAPLATFLGGDARSPDRRDPT